MSLWELMALIVFGVPIAAFVVIGTLVLFLSVEDDE